MQDHRTSTDLQDRLQFVGLDAAQLRSLSGIQPLISRVLGGALDTFYEKITRHPHTARFFKDKSHVTHAKSRQEKHWGLIASGKYRDDYVDGVTSVGKTHARIGLEPRWYIGGYALILEQIIKAVVHEELKGFLHGRKAEKLTNDLAAVTKAALVDMDYAITVYLDALTEERNRLEAQRQATKAEQDTALSALAAVLSKLAEGDLTSEVREQLAPSFDPLKMNFNESVAALEAAMQEINRSVEEVRAEVDGIASATDNMAKRTEHQASALEESAAALEQITTISGQSAKRVREVQAVVQESESETVKSGEIVREAIAAMVDIESSSQKMNQIIGVIDEIAFQTNLLALNAGVEAARAGEQGKGFAVVAQEVRELAQRSAAAAKEIKELIDRSSADVKRGVDLVNLTGESLSSIGKRVGSINENIASLTQSAQEQASGIGEINSAVRSMDQITQQNAALMEEANASVESLSAISGRLAALVGRFRITGTPRDASRPTRVGKAA
ncbi:methyl-accepting chemotaxis protein [Pseudorhizobium sp. NPDC055634]